MFTVHYYILFFPFGDTHIMKVPCHLDLAPHHHASPVQTGSDKSKYNDVSLVPSWLFLLSILTLAK
jgi:hypothetical protein